MTVKLPALAESIQEGEIGSLDVEVGDYVDQDAEVVQVETDKVTVPVTAPQSGIIKEFLVEEGDTVTLEQDIFVIDTDGQGSSGAKEEPAPAAKTEVSSAPAEPTPAPAPKATPAPAVAAPKKAAPSSDDTAPPSVPGVTRVKMTRMRQATANRLKSSQETAAFLTTFNEIDMSGIIELRKKYKDEFMKRHDVKLGFMGLFAKAAAHAAKDQPSVNAFIDGQDIVYHDFVNVSVAVAAPKGLVVPVIRNVESKSVAEIEKDIAEMANKARDGTISVEDMDGGTFTISNGGVFGSLMGTPIINPPQSAVLGMHATFERPVAVNGEVVIRPMMYVALTYDHRLIDGREAVTFLRKIKEAVEDPVWMIMG